MNELVWYAAAFAGVAVIGLAAAGLVLRRRQRISPEHYQEQWREMQKLCGSRDTWQQAVIDADKLLDSVLKKRRMRGKTEGERLTKAQRLLTDNEGVWFGHKLRLKIEADPAAKLKEKDVKEALLGIRQAMKDLGAFGDGSK